MRALALLSLTAVLLGFAADGDRPTSALAPKPVLAGPALVAETQPTTPPKPDAKKPGPKVKSIDDQIKALGLKPCGVNPVMGRWKTAKIEKKLKAWSENGATEFEDPLKIGLNIAGMSKLVEWNKNKRRDADPKGHDQLIADMEAASRKLAEASLAKDSDGVKSAAAALEQSCNDCHARFK